MTSREASCRACVVKPENHDLLAQAGSTKELMQVRYEDQVPGAIYAGANLRNPTKKRVASDSVFTRRPGGKELEDFVAAVLGLAAGEWKTAALLAHEAGVPFGIARRLKWTQLSGGCISWVCHEGTYEVQCSERLNQHLDSLTRDSEFIIPTLALMAEPWAQAEWRKSAHDLPISFKKVIRRFSTWKLLCSDYSRLVLLGQRPLQSLVPKSRDLKTSVKHRLESILAEPSFVPRGAVLRSSPYRALGLDEIGLLVRTLEQEWKLIILCLFYMFISLGELCRLTWEHFNLERGVVDLSARKRMPIHPPS